MLQKEEITIEGRITAVADVFDALASERCYKKAWPMDEVIKYFIKMDGKQFDPRLTKIFLDDIDDFIAIRDKYQDQT